MKDNNFISLVRHVLSCIEKIEKNNISLTEKVNFSDYKATERKYIADNYIRGLSSLQSMINSSSLPGRANELVRLLSVNDLDNNKKVLSELLKFESVEIHPQRATININKIPDEIKGEVKADLEELDKCFLNGCYRSCVILCGRIIEVCLHSKYYHVTGFDILDKNPGIGLGTLIAKMEEKNIKLDPGLTQQIHLINNVRIFSVHKKQRAFYPSRQQTEAIMLYTFDVIEKLF